MLSLNPSKPVRIETDDWIDKLSQSHRLERWKEQDLYIDHWGSCLNQ
jgi:hypothetical protein